MLRQQLDVCLKFRAEDRIFTIMKIEMVFKAMEDIT